MGKNNGDQESFTQLKTEANIFDKFSSAENFRSPKGIVVVYRPFLKHNVSFVNQVLVSAKPKVRLKNQSPIVQQQNQPKRTTTKNNATKIPKCADVKNLSPETSTTATATTENYVVTQKCDHKLKITISKKAAAAKNAAEKLSQQQPQSSEPVKMMSFLI